MLPLFKTIKNSVLCGWYGFFTRYFCLD